MKTGGGSESTVFNDYSMGAADVAIALEEPPVTVTPGFSSRFSFSALASVRRFVVAATASTCANGPQCPDELSRDHRSVPQVDLPQTQVFNVPLDLLLVTSATGHSKGHSVSIHELMFRNNSNGPPFALQCRGSERFLVRSTISVLAAFARRERRF